MTKTINALTEVTSIASGDFIPIWRAANGDTRKISRTNLLGATFTGGGTIITGGYTLTVPATGTAALLGRAQAFTAANTFGSTLGVTGLITASAGITFGDETLKEYDTDNWTPEIADDATAGNAGTATSATGQYLRIGNLVTVWFRIIDINKGSMVAGNTFYIRGFPFPCHSLSTARAQGVVDVSVATFTNSPFLAMTANGSYVTLRQNISGSNSAVLLCSNVPNLSDIVGTITYLTVT